MNYVLIYITAANRPAARRLGAALLRERLIACSNLVGPIEAHYWWQGKMESAHEWLLLAKTRASLAAQVIARVKALHSYQTPCVVALPLTAGNPAFLKWIGQETRPPLRKLSPGRARRAGRTG
jgi:periplasmic divalent cation tolerance protein